MNLFLHPRTRPLIIAHRGSSAHAPENTLAAFALAADQGADAIELDATLTRDGQVVVIHDDTLDRTTDGHGRVDQLPYAEVVTCDAGVKFNAKFTGERVPLLSQVFEAVGQRVLINVEIKSTTVRSTGLEVRVIDLIRQYGLIERVIVSSFNPLALITIKRAEPRVACGLIYSPDEPIYLSRAWLAPLIPNLDARHPRANTVTTDVVKQVHARGQKINVWTIVTPVEVQSLTAAGVDGLIGNDPVMMRTALTGNRSIG
jgi:glycerophosphoryl diester phosphodiesterase